MEVTIDGKVYTASFDEAELTGALGFAASDAVGAEKSYALTFRDESGTNAFTMDVQTKLTALNTNTTPDGESPLTAAALTASSLTVALTNAGGHTFDTTFGAEASTFGVASRAGAGLTFQVGANQGDDMTIYIDKMDANYLGVSSTGVGTQSAASFAIGAVDNAINQVSSQRAYLGAVKNRLDHKIANLDTSAENLTSAESLIRDVDMAKEMTNFTNSNILQQAATAMLAQANSLPQNVLSLIG
ncbi:MAG: hypothetical protein GX585_04490 [Clostridiales bacterium]|nr:hypothetical protein [Clostridiales bacterium]